MNGATAALYEPLIERDLDAIPSAVRRFRESHSSEELFLAVARFAVLAYAPSMHSRHSLLACLAAWDVRVQAGDRFDDLISECARYAAESRRPWSEPPILDPPAVQPEARGDLDALREAVREGNESAAEQWLAVRHEDGRVVHDLLVAASEFPGEYGHAVIVAHAISRLVTILGEKGRFALLRVAVWDLLAAAKAPAADRPQSDGVVALDALIADAADERGSIESTQRVFLFDAAEAAGVLDHVRPLLVAQPRALQPTVAATRDLPVYRLARDYGSCLRAHALAIRRDEASLAALVEAAHVNLREGESFEDWSLA